MRLNSLRPGSGARQSPKRAGRGIGSGLGKTAGRGHKGQKARAGGYHKTGFEGGQMPMQRRLPKLGFRSRIARATAEVRLSDLQKLEVELVDLQALKNANVIRNDARHAKIIASGELKRKVTVKGLRVTKGAKAAIEAAGGRTED